MTTSLRLIGLRMLSASVRVADRNEEGMRVDTRVHIITCVNTGIPACCLRGLQAYPTFANTGTDAAALRRDRRELAGFLAQTSQASTGGTRTATCGKVQWGLCRVEWADPVYYNSNTDIHVSDNNCVVGNPCKRLGFDCRCMAGRSYQGRGPAMLSFNYNYAQFSKHKFGDPKVLLQDPDRLLREPSLGWEAALWLWTTARTPKPSCQEVMQGRWKPTEEDRRASRVPGFGMTTLGHPRHSSGS
eukprot:GHVU01086457.1.p1 GENE.GHVU01086457.1~~GHVU01086457.1.p1  ORF type:complete len:244 (-),score=18.41 GHVU01086457.1:98-829(-)